MIRVCVALILAPLTAFAQAANETDAASAAAPSPMMNFLPLLAIMLVFYFMLIRPQQKRLREAQDMIGALKKGDKVVTAGGIIGKITKLVDDATVNLEIASGVEVSVVKSTITGLVGAPASVTADKKKSGANKNDNSVPSRDNVANDN